MEYLKKLVEYHRHGYGFRHPKLPIQYITCMKTASTTLSNIFQDILRWPIHNYITAQTFDWQTIICVRDPWDWWSSSTAELFASYNLEYRPAYLDLLHTLEPIHHPMGNRQSSYYIGLTDIHKIRFNSTINQQLCDWLTEQHKTYGDDFISSTPDIAGEWIDIVTNKISKYPNKNVAYELDKRTRIRKQFTKPENFETVFAQDYKLWHTK